MIQSFLSSLFNKKLFATVLYIIISLYIFFVWIWSADSIYTSFNGDPDSKLSDLIYGTAHKPYVNRALVPFITRSLHSIVTVNSWESIEQKLLNIPRVQKETVRLGWEQEFLSEYLIALMVAFLSVFIFSFVIKKLWVHFYETPDYINNIIPVIVLLVLPSLYWTGPHYIYDFPALLLFSLGLLLLLKKRWVLFYLIFILGCFNKETMILLTFLHFILYRKFDSSSNITSLLTFQIVLFTVISLLLGIVFSENPGSSLNSHIFLNVRLLLNDYSWTFIVIFSLTIGFVFYDFEKKPLQLRQCAMMGIPFALLIFIFGVITELRTAYEVVPVALFLILHTILFSIFKIPYKIKPPVNFKSSAS